MSAAPSVVLLTADADEQRSWAAALEGAASVRTAADVAALEAELAGAPADAVIAPTDARLLEALQRCRGEARLILCGKTLPAGIIDAAAQGYDLRHVERAESLRGEVYALTRPRSLMVRRTLPGLSVRWSGSLRPAPLLDVSNGGFSFRVELDEELERLLPGALLEGVEILRGDELALAAEAAAVRYVERPADASFYRVGCELAPATAAAAQGPARLARITDGATRAGLLRAALRTTGIFLQAQHGLSSGVTASAGHVDLDRNELRFEAPFSPFEPHDVVRGSFELGNGSYSFLTSAIAAQPLTLRLPRTVDAAHRRGSARYAPSPANPVAVELESPLLPGGRVLRSALEISARGLSFAMDPEDDLFPPGMRLSRIELRLGDLTVACEGTVRNINPLAGHQQLFRCGVLFEHLAPADRARLADGVIRHRYPGLFDARALSFEELWGFFRETGFLYPGKLATLEPMMPAVRHTFEALHGKSDRVFKSLMVREDGGAAIGYLSCVRAYRRSWMVQHLAGFMRRRGRQAPQILNTGLAEYVDHTGVEYLKIYFRPENKWPARVFGGFARRVPDQRLSDLRTFEHLVLRTDAPPLPTLLSDRIEVVEARGAELGVVEQHFVATLPGLLLRSDDLTRSSLELSELSGAFEELGLSRRRIVLLALRKGAPAGFALCELSSPGVNLSELLSAMRLVVLPQRGMEPEQAEAVAAAVRARLFAAAFELYRRHGRSSAVVLLPQGDPLAEALPALSRKRYTCWTVHRTQYRRFCEYIDEIYERLGAAPKARAADEPPGAAEKKTG